MKQAGLPFAGEAGPVANQPTAWQNAPAANLGVQPKSRQRVLITLTRHQAQPSQGKGYVENPKGGYGVKCLRLPKTRPAAHPNFCADRKLGNFFFKTLCSLAFFRIRSLSRPKPLFLQHER